MLSNDGNCGGWPRSLSKGSYLNQFWGVKMEKSLKYFGGHQHIISSMYGWRKGGCLAFTPLDGYFKL